MCGLVAACAASTLSGCVLFTNYTHYAREHKGQGTRRTIPAPY